MKLNFKNIDISRDVLPSLDSTIDNLEDLISVNNTMSIPGDFRYANYLNEYCQYINQMRRNLIDIRDWLNKSNRKYDEAIDEINSALAMIAIEEIVDRGSSVS